MKKSLTKTQEERTFFYALKTSIKKRKFAFIRIYLKRVWMYKTFDFNSPRVSNLRNRKKHRNRRRQLGGINPNTPAKRKWRLAIRDGLFCQMCKKPSSKNDLTVDHFIPASKGGSSMMSNLWLLCRGCNMKKGDKMPEELRLVFPHSYPHKKV